MKPVLEGLHDNPFPCVNGGRPFEHLPHVSTSVSLAVVAGTLAVTAALGLVVRRPDRVREGGAEFVS